MFERAINGLLRARLRDEPRRFIQIVLGPRQVGKTTSVKQVLSSIDLPAVAASADTTGLQRPAWLADRWEEARKAHAETTGPVVLFVDEVQKIEDWSAWVKKFWDEDSWNDRDVRVVLTGSSPLLMQKGLTESLAGRYELIRATHWTWPECSGAFGWDLDMYLFFGGYPGAAVLVEDEARWREYVNQMTFETTVSRDILLMTRVDKPALLRRVFALACEYAGQELSYEKFLGQLQDAGNTTTVAHYLDLLDGAGLIRPLQKYSGEAVRRRRSTPKLAPYNTAMVTAFDGRSFDQARADTAWHGRLAEAAVGARLLADVSMAGDGLYYWRKRVHRKDLETDFVHVAGGSITGIEVKTSGHQSDTEGLAAFREAHPNARTVVVGPGGVPLEEFLERGMAAIRASGSG